MQITLNYQNKYYHSEAYDREAYEYMICAVRVKLNKVWTGLADTQATQPMHSDKEEGHVRERYYEGVRFLFSTSTISAGTFTRGERRWA